MEKTLTVAVCDDEDLALDIISAAVTRVFSTHGVEAQIDLFRRPADLWNALKERTYRLLFLDINMDSIDGIRLGKKIVSHGADLDIVYVSSNTGRVFETFDVNAFGFVRKDNFLKDISGVIERYVRQRLDKADPFLRFELRNRSGLATVNVSLLKYVECLRNEQIFHLDGKENCSVFSRMKTLEEQLIPFGFIRIHKGYLVNCHYIARFDNSSVTLSSGEVLPVGRSKHGEALEAYMEFIRKSGISIIG